MAGRVSPAFPQGGIGPPPPLPLTLPVWLFLTGAVLVLSLAVPGEGAGRTLSLRGFVGRVLGTEAMTGEGTDSPKGTTLRVASALRRLTYLDKETSIWLDRRTPTNCAWGFQQCLLVARQARSRGRGCALHLALLQLLLLAVLRQQARTPQPAGPEWADGPRVVPAGLCSSRGSPAAPLSPWFSLRLNSPARQHGPFRGAQLAPHALLNAAAEKPAPCTQEKCPYTSAGIVTARKDHTLRV